MRLVDRLRSVIIPYPTTSDYTDVGAGILQTYYGGQSQTGERINSDFKSYAATGYAGNGPVFSVLEARRRLFVDATLKYRTLADHRLFGDQALAIFETPWPNGFTTDLLGRMIQDADLAGNAFVHRCSSTMLRRLRPDWVQIVSCEMSDNMGNEWREVQGYLYADNGWQSGEEPEFLLVEDVAHWSPIPDPLASWRGMSWLTPVVREINSDLAMTTHKQKFFDNAATPNMLIKYKTNIGANQLITLRDMLNAGHQGTENAGKTMFIDNGADVTIVGNNFAEMAFTALQAAGEARIASAGGVPPIVAGLQSGLDASTAVASVAALQRFFADSTMHGLWRGACQALEKFATLPPHTQLWFDTRDIPALRDAEMERQKGNAQMSIAAANFVNAGFDPDTVRDALISGDMSVLKHTGLVSVQLLPAGQQPPHPITSTGGTP